MKNKKYNKISFNEKVIQKHYTKMLISDNNDIDNLKIKNFF